MSFVILQRHDVIAVLTLNRPEVMNAWHRPMREELIGHLHALEADAGCRAIVITGAGEKAFCAGQDFNEAKNFNPDQAEDWIEEWRALYGALRDLSKPSIIALNGVAAGSAFQFALYADIRVGHPGARMGQPEIRSGIASILGPWIMRETMGLSRAMEMTVSGRLIPGKEAHAIGLIHHLVPVAADVLPRAMQIAGELATLAPVAMSLNKAGIRRMTQAGFDDVFAAARAAHRASFASGEPQRATTAFLDKKR